MQIIKHGTPKSEKVYTEVCKSCGCEFTLAYKEYEFHSDQQDGDFCSVKCPEPHSKETIYRYTF